MLHIVEDSSPLSHITLKLQHKVWLSYLKGGGGVGRYQSWFKKLGHDKVGIVTQSLSI